MKLTPAQIRSARRHLRAADPVMKAIIDAVGPYTLRFERDRFAMLVRSIVSQQISTIAARAIRKRLMDLVGPDVFPQDDLGVRTAIRDRYGLDGLPDTTTSHSIAAPWRPFASVASWYCWRSLDLARNTETVVKGYPA